MFFSVLIFACALIVSSDAGGYKKRISDGKVAPKHSWQFVARLSYALSGDKMTHSTGFFVNFTDENKQYVVTSAELFQNVIVRSRTGNTSNLQTSTSGAFKLINTGKVRIHFGSTDLIEQTGWPLCAKDTLIRIPIDHVTTLEDTYKMAIITLPPDSIATIVGKGTTFLPISQDALIPDSIDNEKCFIAGWGSTSTDPAAPVYTTELKYIPTFIVPSAQCYSQADMNKGALQACLATIEWADNVGTRMLFQVGDAGAPVMCRRDSVETLMSMLTSSTPAQQSWTTTNYFAVLPEFLYTQMLMAAIEKV